MMDEIRLAIQARHFKSMADSEGAAVLLEINADRERISIYGWDAYQDAELNGVPMGSLIVNVPAFKSIIVGWLAWMLGVEAEQIRQLPQILDQLARYRAAYDALDTALEDEPIYAGDEKHNSRLAKTLSAVHALASWRSISLAEFQDELGIDTNNEDEVDA